MTQEIERCRAALERARSGRTTALVCSGDAGVYGMAGPVLELAPQFPEVEIQVVPGVTAALAGAAVLGALFVGIGVGIIVRQGGSSGGDDALALVISKVSKCRLSFAYLFTDLTVLVLSLSYITVRRIVFSLVTVTISSFLIDKVQSLRLPSTQKE